ncbi:MAG: MerR family transcriptional regulator [Candidatus Sericytochromatia bacterium]|nr:MerR family transcriptional regulator [Candidatus Sericytochromatia bacterium]
MSDTTTLTSDQVAQCLGIKSSQVKNWAVRLPVPSWVESDGTRYFPADALGILETIKMMREEEHSYATIRRFIEPLLPANPQPVTEPARVSLSNERVTEVMSVVRPLWNALQHEHAEAARRLARLEQEVVTLRAERAAMQAQLAALSPTRSAAVGARGLLARLVRGLTLRAPEVPHTPDVTLDLRPI